MTSQRNQEIGGVIVAMALIVIGLTLIFAPALAGMNMMSGGYALRFIGIFIALCGLIVLWFYGRRYAIMARILAGQDILAHWRHAPADAQADAEREFRQRWQQNRSVFLVMAALFIIIGLPVLIIPILQDPDEVGLIILGIYLGIIPLLGLVAWGAPRLAYRRARRAAGDEVIISVEGIYVRGALETWREPLSDLVGVSIDHHARHPQLTFEIRNLTRLGVVHYSTRTVAAPIPASEMAAAEDVVHYFAGRRASAKEN